MQFYPKGQERFVHPNHPVTNVVNRKRPLIIGLTGGIGSGKTKVGYLLKRLKIPLIEADKIAHRLLGRLAVRKALHRLYGDKIFNKRKINHQELAHISFANQRSVNRLNRLLHPLIRKEILRQIVRFHGPVAIDAALLMETRLSDICNFIIFVDADKAIRLKRVAASRRWPTYEISRRERFQMPIRIKKQRADFVINNNGSIKNTFRQIKEIIEIINSKKS